METQPEKQTEPHPIDGTGQPATAPNASLTLDTTVGSVLHRLAGYHPKAQPKFPSAALIYIAAAAFTYLPLVVAAWLSPLPMVRPTPPLRVPFFSDWDIAFLCFVSFPLVLVLTLTDQQALATSLRRVQLDGIVSIPDDSAASLSSIWRRRFQSLNIAAQACGIAVGGIVTYLNYRIFMPSDVGYWITKDSRLVPAGFVFLYCIFLFYSLLPVYILRSLAISFFLKDLVGHAEIRMLPFHPDKSAGLRPMGHLGLRNQYALTVCGVNVLLLALISRHLNAPQLPDLIVAAATACVILGPLVFIGPLLPFRAAMLRSKTELMSEVAQRLRIELQRLRKQMRAGQITKEDEELIDRLRKIGAVIDELPVWPFDAGTLRKFLTAYVIPVLGAVALQMAKSIPQVAKAIPIGMHKP